MAESIVDIPINLLPESLKIGDTDLIVIQQGEAAVKVSGATLKSWLYEVSQAHGMIQSIDKAGTSGLVDTYRITLADGTTSDFSITNGNGIKSIVPYFGLSAASATKPTRWSSTAPAPTAEQRYLWTYNYITYDNGSTKVSTQYICAVYGEQGIQGNPPAYQRGTRMYQVSESGTEVPTGEWLSAIPNVPQGKFLWIRATETFDTGTTDPVYSVTRMGLDGSGSVSSVAGISPNGDGDVRLEPEDIGAISQSGGDVFGEIAMTGNPISGLPAPSEDSQAVNKQYVDTAVHLGAFSARGSSVALALPERLVTQLILDSPITGGGKTEFTFSGGGVKVPHDGVIAVSGAVYIISDAKTEMFRGTYVYRNDDEITSSWDIGKPYGAVGTPMAMVPVSAGDVIYLKARSFLPTTCNPSAAGTHLDIIYV